MRIDYIINSDYSTNNAKNSIEGTMKKERAFMKMLSIALFLLLVSTFAMNAQGVIKVEGEITTKTDNSITVQGKEFAVTSTTVIYNKSNLKIEFGDLEEGDYVEVKGVKINNVLTAKVIKLEDEDDDNRKTELEVEGTISSLSSDMITVNGTTFTLNSETKVIMELFGLADLSDLKVGQFVVVKGKVKNGENAATRIKVKNEVESELEVEGKIEALTDDMITVNGTTFTLTSETIIVKEGKGKIESGDLEVGMMVEVKGFVSGGENIAKQIKVENEDNENIEIEVEGEITALTDSEIIVSGTTFTLKESTIVIVEGEGKVDLSSLELGQYAEVKGYVSNGINYAKIIKIKKEDDYEIKVKGEITAIGSSTFTVNETDFTVNSETEIYDENHNKLDFSYLETGMYVHVKAVVETGENIAVEISVKNKDMVMNSGNHINYMEDNTIVVGDQIYHVDSETDVYDEYGMIMSYYELALGMEVEVRDNIKDDELYAARIDVISSVSSVEVTTATTDISLKSCPNPFTSRATLEFNLPVRADVSINLYDQSGSRIMEVHSGSLHAGVHQFQIGSNSNLTAGVYFARIVINGRVYNKTMIKAD